MSATKISTRYAAALLNLTKADPQTQDAVQAALGELSQLFSHKEIGKVLSSPVVPQDLLRDVFKNALSQLKAPAILTNFLPVLIEARRVSLLPEISSAFQHALRQNRGCVEATVETAVALGATELADIQSKLETMLKKKVYLTPKVQPDILGGFVIRIENSLIDMSLKSKLENMLKIAVS